MKLENSELYQIKGGASKNIIYGIALGVGALITLVAGILDGYKSALRKALRIWKWQQMNYIQQKEEHH